METLHVLVGVLWALNRIFSPKINGDLASILEKRRVDLRGEIKGLFQSMEETIKKRDEVRSGRVAAQKGKASETTVVPPAAAAAAAATAAAGAVGAAATKDDSKGASAASTSPSLGKPMSDDEFCIYLHRCTVRDKSMLLPTDALRSRVSAASALCVCFAAVKSWLYVLSRSLARVCLNQLLRFRCCGTWYGFVAVFSALHLLRPDPLLAVKCVACCCCSHRLNCACVHVRVCARSCRAWARFPAWASR